MLLDSLAIGDELGVDVLVVSTPVFNVHLVHKMTHFCPFVDDLYHQPGALASESQRYLTMNNTLIPLFIIAHPFKDGFRRLALWGDNHQAHLSIDPDKRFIHYDLSTTAHQQCCAGGKGQLQ